MREGPLLWRRKLSEKGGEGALPGVWLGGTRGIRAPLPQATRGYTLGLPATSGIGLYSIDETR